MSNYLQFMLESGACLLAFLLFYQVFLRNQTRYQLNRAYLISSLLFAMVVPWINLELSSTARPAMFTYTLDTMVFQGIENAEGKSRHLPLADLLVAVYLSVAVLLGFRIGGLLWRIRRLSQGALIVKQNGYRLVIHSGDHPPFSLFRRIYLSRGQYEGKKFSDIIEHEKAHVRQMHTLDMILAEGLIILQWFNPLAWIFKRMIVENHEFLADQAVLNRGFCPESYQLRIIAQLFGIRSLPTAHYFNQSMTEKRLKMMKKPKLNAVGGLKVLLVLPLAAALFLQLACSKQEAGTTNEEMEPYEVTMIDGDNSKESLVYFEPDVMAEPEGGMMAYRRHIADNLIYPEEAKKQGVDGKIFIRFVVDEQGKIIPNVKHDGKLIPPPPPKKEGYDGTGAPPKYRETSNPGVVVVGYRPVGQENPAAFTDAQKQLLIDEALRVIQLPYKWKPATVSGKPVKVQMTFPIQFKLQ